MQYLASFARTALFKVLTVVKDKSLTIYLFALQKLKYAISHPIKTIIYLIKVYITLLILTFLLVFTFSSMVNAQTVYESSTGHAPSSQRQCFVYATGGIKTPYYQRIQQLLENARNNKIAQYADSPDFKTENDQQVIPFQWFDEMNCSGGERWSMDIMRLNTSSGEWYLHTTFNYGPWPLQYGFPETNDGCPPESNSDATFPHDSGSGLQCYDPFELTNNSDCDVNSNELFTSNDHASQMACYTKDDGSKCTVEQITANGMTFYQQALEPSTCYGSELPDFEHSENSQPPQDGCVAIGGGVIACAENPENVCDDQGNCIEGCGWVDFGSGTEFLCLSDDTDGDGVPDYVENIPDEPDPTTPDAPEPTNPDVSTGESEIIKAVNNQSILLDEISTNTQNLNSGINNVASGIGQVNNNLNDIKNQLQPPDSDVNYDIPQELTLLGEGNDYTTRNFGTVMQNAVNQMQTAPLTQAVDSFFAVSFGGTCPVYSGEIPYINTTITFDQLCSPTMQNIFPIVSTIIILVFSFLAFRVAVL